MKKILLPLLLLLGFVSSGVGIYMAYFSDSDEMEAIQSNNNDIKQREEALQQEKDRANEDALTQETSFEPTNYYSKVVELKIYEAMDETTFGEVKFYFGDTVTVLDIQAGWGRISPFYTYTDTADPVAEWVKMEELSLTKPAMNKEETRSTLLEYARHSDNVETNIDAYIKAMDTLIKKGECTLGDFSQTQGWIRSTRYTDGEVYFVYCGEMKRANKVYLDVQSGEVFYR
ncbi:hypothetical protein N9R79_03245 [Vibrio sp.]|nr:hypothetical protein [Vibrio sp.]